MIDNSCSLNCYTNFMVKVILVLIAAYIIFQLLYSAYFLQKSAALVKKIHTGTFTFGDKKNLPYSIFLDGDSVAAGVGATSPKTAIEGRIGEYLSKDKYVTIQNTAVSGSRMGDLATRALPDKKQDLIILIISSNDLFHFQNLNSFKDSTQKVLARYSPIAKKLIIVGPGRIFDADAVPIVLKPIYRLKAKDYSKVISDEVGKYENVVYINPTETTLSLKDYSFTGASDHFHPNDEGQRFWFDMIRPSL